MTVKTVKAPFDPNTCKRESTRLAFGKAVLDLGTQNENVVFLTADGATPTGTLQFFKNFPNRAYNVGIAEQNLIGIAAGMATCGLKPIVGGYAPFLAFRSYEQIRNDIAYTKQNVTIGGVYSGISLATGGSTHHTTEDIAAFRATANLTVITPADATEAYKTTIAAVDYPNCVFIRLGGRTPEPVLYQEDYKFKIGKAVPIRDGDDATIIATGPLSTYAAIASDLLKDDGLKIKVLNMHTVKPLDEKVVIKAAQDTGRILTIEEHNVLGGLGSAVSEVVTTYSPIPVKRLGINDIFASIGSRYSLQSKYGLTPERIASSVKDMVSII
jgi:transketolase